MNNKIGNYEVDDYVESFDGSVDGVKFVEDVDGKWELYERDDGMRFLICNFEDEDEYILRVVG